ncbi:hypothetical protein FP507_08785 [Chlorobium phaeovibrioides]|uniref:OmpH family outer membrane protein n=1 Tax=Chlorobium phaeovibrioides TaxID=1094 RepID=A0A5M8ICL1_CHLPH|nr:hypothetical protein [Chlorobium phaeovibrioides]KAA6233123.1 hypothetical protein FP507_08785 [Chlorobium phaeovibrioides]MDT9547672.1 hypothetical protein [Chlorobium phaeovibrioides]
MKYLASFLRLLLPMTLAADAGGAGAQGPAAGDPPAGAANGAPADKTFTQAELDRIVADRLHRATQQFDGVDVAEYRKMKEAEAAKIEEDRKKKGEFDKILAETVQKKDSEIEKLARSLAAERIDGTLMREAAAQKAINPTQVMALLKGQVRLTDGALEVLDLEGKPMYKESKPVTPRELVESFLQENAHFVAAGGSGSGAGNGSGAGGAVGRKLADLDFSSSEDRKFYEEHFMKAGK